MSSTQRLIFHVGLEKTGTTSLQALLHTQEVILSRHSVVYPKRNLAYGYMNHAPLAACYIDDDAGDKWFRVSPRRRNAVVGSLIKTIEAARADTAVISSEHFSSRLRDDGISALKADFGDYDCRVVIVLRDHFHRLCSSYVTYVINGGSLTLDAFAAGALRPGARDLRYADLIAPWIRIFGSDCVTPIMYGQDVLARTLASIAPGLDAAAPLQTERLKTSAGPDVIAALRLVNVVAARPSFVNYLEWLKAQQLRAQIKTWLLGVAPDGATKAAWSLDQGCRDLLAQTAADDVAELASRYGIVMPLPEIPVAASAIEHEDPAELLARALLSRATRPLTKASLLNAGLSLGVGLRDRTYWLRERLALK